MVESGQQQIRRVPFRSVLHGAVPVEVIDRSALMRRFDSRYFARPDRHLFTMLMFIWDGHGSHMIDFEQVELTPGRCIRIDPQQVHAWDVSASVEATLVLSSVSTPTPTPTSGSRLGRVAGDLDDRSVGIARSLTHALAVEQVRFDGDDASTRLMADLFGALDALHDRAAGSGERAAMPTAYLDFRQALEESIGSTHDVRSLVAELGYSERTVSRACQRATGLTAKGVLVERLILEAKRLLAYTDQPASLIGEQLGFSEATNFHKFFVRHEGCSPNDFRTAMRTS